MLIKGCPVGWGKNKNWNVAALLRAVSFPFLLPWGMFDEAFPIRPRYNKSSPAMKMAVSCPEHESSWSPRPAILSYSRNQRKWYLLQFYNSKYFWLNTELNYRPLRLYPEQKSSVGFAYSVRCYTPISGIKCAPFHLPSSLSLAVAGVVWQAGEEQQ